VTTPAKWASHISQMIEHQHIKLKVAGSSSDEAMGTGTVTPDVTTIALCFAA